MWSFWQIILHVLYPHNGKLADEIISSPRLVLVDFYVRLVEVCYLPRKRDCVHFLSTSSSVDQHFFLFETAFQCLCCFSVDCCPSIWSKFHCNPSGNGEGTQVKALQNDMALILAFQIAEEWKSTSNTMMWRVKNTAFWLLISMMLRDSRFDFIAGWPQLDSQVMDSRNLLMFYVTSTSKQSTASISVSACLPV